MAESGTLTDSQLVKRCIEGDEKAWDAIVDRYMRLVYSIPLSYGASREDAADIAQEVFLRLFENLGKLKDASRLAAWLKTTTQRESWKWLKKWNREISVDWDGEASAVADPHSVDDLADRIERYQALKEAMMLLGERCRRLLNMLFYRQPKPSYREISEETGIPEGAIGPTRARCLKKLKRIMEGGR